MPRVSVVVPNFNHAPYLEARLRSILDQTYRDFELIILDDASTDNSREILAGFVDDPRVRTIFNETNSGSVFRQWNRGFREARGEYVWIAESDDVADPSFLETLVGELDRFPTAGIAYCQSWVIDEHGTRDRVIEQTRRIREAQRWSSDFFNSGQDECARHFVLGCIINNASSALVRRGVVESIGYADENWRVAGDWVFWVKMLCAADIRFIAKPLNYWRQHSSTVRSGVTRNGVMVEESYRVLSFVAKTVRIDPRTMDEACSMRFHDWICYNEDYHFSLAQNAAIYRSARRVDRHLNRRILLYIPKAPIRMIGRPIKRWLKAGISAARAR